MTNAMKFEMMYQARMLSSKIIMKAMSSKKMDTKDTIKFLKSLKDNRFKSGFYDENKNPIYTDIKYIKSFKKSFFMENKSCCSVLEDKSNHLGIHFVVLKESGFVYKIQNLRIKIISYLMLSFIVMGMVGYLLGRLFLRPVREQIEALDNFISDTTHELNTPISAILMTIQSLKNVEEKKLKRLEASAKRLSIMYSSLTYRINGRVEKSEILCFAQIVKDRVNYTKELIESKRLTITLDIEPTKIKISKTSANRLIDNLLSNSIKYSNLGDKIFISLKDNIFKIQDTGIGIDKKQQKDIFKRYHRANDERGGFGIGLSIVLSICKEYNIKMDLKSKKSVGSVFTLFFPRI
jgi:two-component system OmpR family sensor kinase